MKTQRTRRDRSHLAFTLVELLVVIAIIGVLASMLLPAIGSVQVKGQVTRAKTDISNIQGAISAYQSKYGAMPMPKLARQYLADVSEVSPDFTFGTIEGGAWARNKQKEEIQIQTQALNMRSQLNNSEVMAILINLATFPNGTPTMNPGSARNPENIKFINVKQVSAKVAGLGPDGVFRDPWNNPYIISLDANGDDKVRDGFYSLDAVSGDPKASGLMGLNGLIRPKPGQNNFEKTGDIMVWSLGPDGQADPTVSSKKKPNLDNILGE